MTTRNILKHITSIKRSNIFLPSWTYFIIFALLCGSIATTLFCQSQSTIQSFGINLTTELIGIILTLVVVDLAVKINEQHNLTKYKAVAFSRMRKSIIEHARLLTYMYKASVSVKPAKVYVNISDLFGEDYFNEIKNLDLSARAPTIPDRIWYQYISLECNKFSECITKTLDKYAIHLEPEISELLENIYDSNFFGIFLERFPLRRFDGTCWVHLDNIFEGGIIPSFTGILEGQTSDFLKEHVAMFVKLIDIYNHSVPTNKTIKFDNQLWSETIAPTIGSGRVTAPEIV